MIIQLKNEKPIQNLLYQSIFFYPFILTLKSYHVYSKTKCKNSRQVRTDQDVRRNYFMIHNVVLFNYSNSN